MKKTGIYVHIPFCVKKCSYCDFTSGAFGDDIKEQYVNVLCQEIKDKADKENANVHTIYIGGGTPSLLQPKLTDKLLNTLYQNYYIENNAEISMEVNPGTVNLEKLDIYKKLGINRISIGLQSSIDEELKSLGRIHTRRDFEECYNNVLKVGINNINVDVMSAIPGQTMESYMKTLEYVVGINPAHISSYSLIIEPDTPFFDAYKNDKLDLPDEDTERKMYEATGNFLKENGYLRYEISNYAKKGFECKHNNIYWSCEDYIGFGVAAASCINHKRITNIKSVKSYIENYPNVEDEIISLTKNNEMEEFMFLGLRKIKGINESEFKKRFGMDIDDVYKEVIVDLCEKALLYRDNNIIRITDKGLDLSNYVMSEFIL